MQYSIGRTIKNLNFQLVACHNVTQQSQIIAYEYVYIVIDSSYAHNLYNVNCKVYIN